MEIEALVSGVQPPPHPPGHLRPGQGADPQSNGYSFTEDIKQSVNKVRSKVADRKRNEKK